MSYKLITVKLRAVCMGNLAVFIFATGGFAAPVAVPELFSNVAGGEIRWTAHPGVGYRVLESSDLVQWSPVQAEPIYGIGQTLAVPLFGPAEQEGAESHSFVLRAYDNGRTLVSWEAASGGFVQTLIDADFHSLAAMPALAEYSVLPTGGGPDYKLALRLSRHSWMTELGDDPALNPTSRTAVERATLALLDAPEVFQQISTQVAAGAAGAVIHTVAPAPSSGPQAYYRIESLYLDSDGDGLEDWQEMGDSDPYHPDTDRDGFGDGWEQDHGQNPSLPDDFTQDPNADYHLVVKLTIGDTSESASEVYRLLVYELDADGHENPKPFFVLTAEPNNPPAAKTLINKLRKDTGYAFVIDWVETRPPNVIPDLDYVFDVSISQQGMGHVILDPEGMLFPYIAGAEPPDDYRPDTEVEPWMVDVIDGTDNRPRVYLLPARFRAAEACNGFDDVKPIELGAPWQSVPAPHQGTTFEREVNFVTVPGFLDHFEFESADPAIATVTEGARSVAGDVQTVAITGQAVGQTAIRAKVTGAGTTAATVNADVLPRREVSVAYRAIALQGESMPDNVPTPGELQGYLNNFTWGKQANVFFTVTREAEDELNYDLDSDGKFDPFEFEILPFAKYDDGSVDFYVFIVDKIDGGEGVTTGKLRNGIPYTSWVENEHLGTQLYVIAHELGHSLGVTNPEHNNLNDQNLMFQGDFPHSPCEIRKQDWEQVHP